MLDYYRCCFAMKRGVGIGIKQNYGFIYDIFNYSDMKMLVAPLVLLIASSLSWTTAASGELKCINCTSNQAIQ